MPKNVKMIKLIKVQKSEFSRILSEFASGTPHCASFFCSAVQKEKEIENLVFAAIFIGLIAFYKCSIFYCLKIINCLRIVAIVLKHVKNEVHTGIPKER